MKGLWNVFQNHICNRVTNAIQVHLENAAITHMDWSRSPLNFIIHLTRLRVWAWDSDECAGSPFPPYSDSDITVSPLTSDARWPCPGPDVKCHQLSANHSRDQMELTNQRLIRQGARDQSNDHVILSEAILSPVLSLYAEPRQSQALVTGFFALANV